MSNKPTGKQLLALVGNPDVYAVQRKNGSWSPVRERLTPKVIRAHRAGEVTVGTYIVKPPNLARTLVFDIDEKDEKERTKMLNQVCRTLESLDSAYGPGLYWAVEFSGMKGWHVWVVSDEYIESAILYRLGRGIREEAGYPAMEVFPKQTEVRDLGNLVKLPGGVHAVSGNENNFIGAATRPTDHFLLEKMAEQYPEIGLHGRRVDAPVVIEYPCVNDIQKGAREGNRNTSLFHLATMLRRFSISDENIEYILGRANELGADGPLDPAELESIIENSQWSGPICGQLPDDVHCADQCIIARHTGLYTRPGSLKWGAEGEVATVELGERTVEGTVIELKHPDMIQGRAVLAEIEASKRGS